MRNTIFPYVPRTASSVSVEVQDLYKEHPALNLGVHGHAFFELIILAEGKGQLTVSGQTFHAKPRSVLPIPPGVFHDLSALSPSRGWAVLFMADSLDQPHSPGLAMDADEPTGMLFNSFRKTQAAPTLLTLDKASYERVEWMIGHLQRELVDRREGYAHSARSALQMLLIELARSAHRASENPDQRIHSNTERQFLENAFRDIDAHFDKHRELAAASKRLNISPGHLTTRLGKLTGRTYRQWVIERQMIEARHLLATTDSSLSHIADRIGYAELESFVRRFKAHHGMTPAAWRRQIIAEPSSNRSSLN